MSSSRCSVCKNQQQKEDPNPGTNQSENVGSTQLSHDHSSEIRTDYHLNNYHSSETRSDYQSNAANIADKLYGHQSNNDHNSETPQEYQKNYSSESEEEYTDNDDVRETGTENPSTNDQLATYQANNENSMRRSDNYQSKDEKTETWTDTQSNKYHITETETNNQSMTNNDRYLDTRDDYRSSESEEDHTGDDYSRNYNPESTRRGHRYYKKESREKTIYSGAHHPGGQGDNHESNGHRKHESDQDKKHNSHKLRKVRVKMPSGLIAYITKPFTSAWRCGVDKTKLIKLHPNGRMGREEYQLVANEMRATMQSSMFCYFREGCFSSYNIIKIQKIINGCLWKKYRKFQAVVHKEVGYTNERMMFHGTDKIRELLDGGFDERYSNIDGRFGAGIYFARHSSKSNQYAFGNNGSCKKHNDSACFICVRQILLCRVTLGKVHQLVMGQKYAHAPPGYHSVEGTPGITNAYPENIMYRGEQAYPEYLISYKIVK